jgi:hypothetical protein
MRPRSSELRFKLSQTCFQRSNTPITLQTTLTYFLIATCHDDDNLIRTLKIHQDQFLPVNAYANVHRRLPKVTASVLRQACEQAESKTLPVIVYQLQQLMRD